MSKITVSFKNTKKEQELFNFFDSFEQGEKSDIIKEILYKYYLDNRTDVKEEKKETFNIDVSDF